MKYLTKLFFLICCVLPLCFTGCKPVVTITAPANGDTFAVGETITFEGKATDQQHPDLGDDAFVWISDKDGEIATGASFTTAGLSEGEHTITLTVTDPSGQSGQSSIKITIGNDGTSTSTTTIESIPTTTITTGTEPATTTSTATEPSTTTTIPARFNDNGDGTVTDTRTGLIWLKNANPCGNQNWYYAVDYCSTLANGKAGLTDGSTAGQWRLPSIQELEGIGTDPPTTYCLDGSCQQCPVTWTMPGAPFTNVLSDFYWSGTSYVSSNDFAWFVYMDGGVVYYDVKSDGCYGWPVRGGN